MLVGLKHKRKEENMSELVRSFVYMQRVADENGSIEIEFRSTALLGFEFSRI